ncbi:hypothetical protein [Luteimicrobium album]|uniref:hypothetical protein n=1 Tax=Luteimicrobium album TaxID=1054550 RepID=UPI0024E19457|nr:hypothetical protein [Luteimicrobium album]
MARSSVMRRGAARRVVGGVVVGLAVAGLAACSGVQGSSPTPSWFADREPLSPCGSVTSAPGSDGALPADALACLAAGAHDGAELTVGSYITEGDLIVSYYRVGPGIDGIEVITDATRDAFGPREWRLDRCPDATSVTDLGTCAPAG